MGTINVGRVRPAFKGVYDLKTAYKVLERVRYNGSVWECVADAPAGTAPQSGVDTFWMELGVRGEPGAVGAAGPAGPQGPRGERGLKGETGDTGPAGPRGVAGADGAPGPEGPMGPEGERGTTPVITVNVKTLAPTEQATVEKSGSVDNPVFLIGIPQGRTGEPLRILGSYDTEEELKRLHPTGVLGDSYMVAGDLYAWNTSGWKNVGRIQGPRGDTGARGPQGAKGDTGPRGPQGIKGPQGAIGPQGPRGEAGTTDWSGILNKPALLTKVEADKLYLGVNGTVQSAQFAQSVPWSGVRDKPEGLGSNVCLIKSSYTEAFAFGGYRVWTNGLIEQWGESTMPLSGEVTVTLPKTFQGQDTFMCFPANVSGPSIDADGQYKYMNIQTLVLSRSSIVIAAKSTAGDALTGRKVRWYAIGK